MVKEAGKKSETKRKSKSATTKPFQAEVGRLLDIVTHALYSEREIFLRELISNAADACDRRRYESISQPDLATSDELGVTLRLDKEARLLTVSDNGIGMDKATLEENLGTLARSGTSAFLEGISGDKKSDVNLIGQFGVGFYSAFMVADRVRVVSRSAGSDTAHAWISDGREGFTLESTSRDTVGTDIILSMKADSEEFLEPARIRRIVETYSNHIPFPIHLLDGEESDLLNQATALWTLPKDKITDDQHREFYRHTAHAFDEPWESLHFKAEGMIEYQGLMYIPSERPYDLFHPERSNRLKLYVKRVFITDHCEQLVPAWLRFLRGVVDSEDLPLNVSREMLQNNPVIGRIRSGLVRRVLDALKKRAEETPEDYLNFWKTFGLVLKEGLCELDADRAPLLALSRFHSVKSGPDSWISLESYKESMKEGQKAIYYLSGEDEKALLASPHLEGFKARGIDVLLFTDPVDEFWVGYVGTYADLPFTSVTRAGSDLDDLPRLDDSDDKADGTATDAKKTDAAESEKAIQPLLQAFKASLGELVSDVVCSQRLTDSPVCLVSGSDGPDLHLERLMRQHRQSLDFKAERILEINPTHALIKGLARQVSAETVDSDQKKIKDAAYLLYDQARLLEGEAPVDPPAFARRLNQLILNSV